ncbi:hypothetical protein BF17_21125 [Yersinia similis]|uniref:DUF4354 domain-containing protein n=1 Tax=Yersinia similis TaxID=367190 RepID=A0ABN4CRH8_9GAMM|nr:DUF4354 family protein [Yersinia similis]AHK21492.1 hypothetical protein BF17_21125 [Yersinia similis]CFQ62893.1 Uncharacterised protein [Yersinia similis]CNB59461.1 Uncharacterised protein [Yersinia similis]CNE97872.1 Uncharacterised protein [Yersinia similis]
MKAKYILSVATLCLVSFTGLAATITNSVTVYATQQNKGSISIGDKSYYTKDFKVFIANLSDNEIDLSSLCLAVHSPDGKTFKLDTVDETLIQGKLKPQAMVEGVAVFSAEDDSVYRAAIVKVTDKCK